MIDLQSSRLRCDYGHASADVSRDDSTGGLLGSVFFSREEGSRASLGAGIPVARVPMPVLGTEGSSIWEIWRANGSASHGRHGIVQYGYADGILFGAIQLSEGHFSESGGEVPGQTLRTPLYQAAALAYKSAFEAMKELQFPHALRFWNYIADINGYSHGIERYRQFNCGRQEGFLQSEREVTGSVPAASAVGFASGPLTVYFLAARDARPVAIENPRQVSAYLYPTSYGPRSPTFSRAGLVSVGSERVLFVSGTASIVGHQTCHPGDVVAQTRETMANIAAILSETCRVAPDAPFSLADLSYKVYVRDQNDMPQIAAELRRHLGRNAKLLFLKADICRQDLLVEIEATASHALDSPDQTHFPWVPHE